jgi:hypothetical protein
MGICAVSGSGGQVNPHLENLKKSDLSSVSFLQGHTLPGGSFAHWHCRQFVKRFTPLVQEVVKDFESIVWNQAVQGRMLIQHLCKTGPAVMLKFPN